MDSDSYVDISTNSAKILEIYKKAAIVAKGMTQAELDIKLKDVKILPPKCAGGHYKFKYSMDDGKDIVVNSVYKLLESFQGKKEREVVVIDDDEDAENEIDRLRDDVAKLRRLNNERIYEQTAKDSEAVAKINRYEQQVRDLQDNVNKYRKKIRKLQNQSRTDKATIAQLHERFAKCQVCDVEMAKDVMMQLKCGHRACRTCLDMHIKARVDMSAPITCPCAHECGKLAVADLGDLGWLPRLCTKAASTLPGMSIQGAVMCTEDNCGGIWSKSMVSFFVPDVAACNKCGKLHCVACNEVLDKHEGGYPSEANCKRIQEASISAEMETVRQVLDAEGDRDIHKACPNCLAALNRTGGCNTMKCGMCSTYFCWLCGCIPVLAVPDNMRRTMEPSLVSALSHDHLRSLQVMNATMLDFINKEGFRCPFKDNGPNAMYYGTGSYRMPSVDWFVHRKYGQDQPYARRGHALP